MTQPAREAVRRAFDRAAHSYDSASQIQRRVCSRLALGLPAMMTPGIILDVGCGTGYALRMLRERFPPANLVGLDLSPAMLNRIRLPAYRLAGDAEQLPLADASVGLYWSSLTLQWCRLPAALGEACRVLWKGGHLAMATLGPETFSELRRAFGVTDRYQHTIHFLAPDEIAGTATASGFSDLRIRRETQIAYYPDLKSALRAIKSIGANQVGAGRRRGLMSRESWRGVEKAYEAFRQEQGLPLTYDVITVHAEK